MANVKKKAEDKRPTHVPVFVYGTLKKGHRLHEWMNGSNFNGPDVLNGHTLLDLGPYPALVKVHTVGADFSTSGEVYEMPYKNFQQLRVMEENVGYRTVEVVTAQGTHCHTFLFAELPAGMARWVTEKNTAKVVVDPDDDIPF